MKYRMITVGLAMLTLGTGCCVCAWASSDAAVAGVVRDAQGIPQMGALVELLAPDASIVGRAFTDDHGRYRLYSISPGKYELRASAAFLLPAVRGNLSLQAGAHAVADLTMTAIFEAGAWLPAERRRTAEPVDDWRWTLRSSASRPLLRAVGGSGQVHPSLDGEKSRDPRGEGRITLLAGNGQFGQGGVHQVVAFDHMGSDGAVEVLRASFGAGLSAGSAASFSVAGGVQRDMPFGGKTRLLVSYVLEPELVGADHSGVQTFRSAATERVILGDSVVVDAGTLLSAERMAATSFVSAPYVRVAVHPSPELTLEYRLATDRTLQQSEDLDGAELSNDPLSDGHGEPLSQKGLHQEIVATQSKDKHILRFAVYRDDLPVQGVQGGGHVNADTLLGLPLIADPSTGTFRVALQGLTSSGARISWTETFTPVLSACVEADLGRAVQAKQGAVQVAALRSQVSSRQAVALRASSSLRLRRIGSSVNVSYRWQPRNTLTQVAEYDVSPGDAFLAVGLTQHIWSGRHSNGLTAVVEGTNLLAEGYEPMVGPADQMLFLAQVPRALLAGIAFSF